MKKVALAFMFLFLASIGFSATTYFPDETGQFIVRIENAYSQPIPANCTAIILYPDKTAFINGTPMVITPTQNYYINFTIPNVLGIYETEAVCDVQVTPVFFNTLYQTGSFKVELPMQVNLTNITNQLSEINNSIFILNNTVNQIYSLNQEINVTVTQTNLTVNDINSTVNYINYSINNFNTTIVANITGNITGNLSQAVSLANDDLWRRIRNLLLALFSIRND
jgi:hypothetical protein